MQDQLLASCRSWLCSGGLSRVMLFCSTEQTLHVLRLPNQNYDLQAAGLPKIFAVQFSCTLLPYVSILQHDSAWLLRLQEATWRMYMASPPQHASCMPVSPFNQSNISQLADNPPQGLVQCIQWFKMGRLRLRSSGSDGITWCMCLCLVWSRQSRNRHPHRCTQGQRSSWSSSCIPEMYDAAVWAGRQLCWP